MQYNRENKNCSVGQDIRSAITHGLNERIADFVRPRLIRASLARLRQQESSVKVTVSDTSLENVVGFLVP